MIGKTLAHYKIVEKIGEGGMGEVYRARDVKLDRDVALKVLPESVANDPKRVARFEREAKAVARISHPNLLEIHNFATHAGVTFAVTELLEGEDLAKRLARGPIGWHQAAELGASIAEGLAAAHQKGIIHRDIKPQNVFLTVDGQVKVLDFGLARLTTESSTLAETTPDSANLTETGVVLGTAPYMSPEQVRGHRCDPRSDIFSLGCVLYEMVTGQQPFARATAAETFSAILEQDPQEPSTRSTGVPPALSHVIMQCLRKVPDDRLQSARDLASALQSVSDGRTPDGSRATTWSARRTVLTLLIPALAAALVATVFWKWPRDTESAAAFDPTRVAVAVFDNRTGDSSLDPIGFMACDWVTQGLAQAGLSEVVPSATTLEMHHMLRAADARQRSAGSPHPLANETSAGTIVTGAYYRQGETLQFQSQITDGRNGDLLHAIAPVETPSDDPAVALNLLRKRVVEAVTAHLDADLDINVTSHVPVLEAYREYAIGRDLLSRNDSEALPRFQRAVELDPAFVSARFWLAYTLGWVGQHAQQDSLLELVHQQREQLSPYEALLLDAMRAVVAGKILESLVHQRAARRIFAGAPMWNFGFAAYCASANRFREAAAVLEEMGPKRDLLPGPQQIHRYNLLSHAYLLIGNLERSLEVIRQGIEEFPEESSLRGQEAAVLIARGELDAALRIVRDSETLPSVYMSHGRLLHQTATVLRIHGFRKASEELAWESVEWYRKAPAEVVSPQSRTWGMGRALYLAEAWEESAAHWREIARQDPDNLDCRGRLGTLAARRGDHESAERIAGELERLETPYLYGRDTYWRARIAALLGQNEKAMDLLRAAFLQGMAFAPGWTYRLDMDLEPLRDHPPFQEFTEPKG